VQRDVLDRMAFKPTIGTLKIAPLVDAQTVAA
jgi:hypothetical protein